MPARRSKVLAITLVFEDGPSDTVYFDRDVYLTERNHTYEDENDKPIRKGSQYAITWSDDHVRREP
jgi:hypothetical protein